MSAARWEEGVGDAPRPHLKSRICPLQLRTAPTPLHLRKAGLNAHRVSDAECEEVFFNRPFVVRRDVEHSQEESRFYALGQTDRSRELFVVFTIRGKLIRVISARDMTRKERRIYQIHEKNEQKGHSQV
ncbi:MAG: BrnT family toxin [Terriglobia bacterium]